MILQVVVKLRGHRAQLRQIVPWDRGQIVVLIVVAHIQRDAVDRPVVTERLLIDIIRVMLLHPTSAYWMQANRKETCAHERKKPRPAEKLNTKAHRTRRNIWHISEHAHHFVPAFAPEH